MQPTLPLRTLAAILAICLLDGAIADGEEREWPFTTPKRTPAKQVDFDWGKNDIDTYILARLDEAGLRPAPRAQKHQLIRRLHFDLIGLPPTPEEIEAYLSDESDKAYESLVDRLLADPRYGERWARLWLDLARYADTAGFEGDPDLPNAWRYRDYVIDAFNNDKPYDLFIKEQIAGDEFHEVMGAAELPNPSPEQIVALTFLRLAPFTEPRGDETRHEMLSEMTSTVSSVFLGLTVGCAKCHDHKYDAIPTEDFYRMKAFFSTVSLPPPARGDGFQIGGSIPAAFYRKGEADWAKRRIREFKREIDESKVSLRQLRKRLTSQLGGTSGFGLQAMGGPLGNDYVFGRSLVNDNQLHLSIVNCDGKRWTFFTDGKRESSTGSNAGSNQGKWFGDIATIKHVALGQYSEGRGRIATPNAHHVGEFAQIMLFDHPLSDEERAKLSQWAAAAAPSEAPPLPGLKFWLDARDLDADSTQPNPKPGATVTSWKDKIAGVLIEQDQAEHQPQLVHLDGPAGRKTPAVRFENDYLRGSVADASWASGQQHGALVVVYTARHQHEGYGFEIGGDGVFLSTFINPVAADRENFDAVLDDPNNSQITDRDRSQYRRLAQAERLLRGQIKRLQPVAMSLRHSFGPPYEPGVPTSRVMIRGEYDNPGEVVEAGFLSCITGDQKAADIRLDPFKRWPTRSRRMALAKWIASPENPLTARVMMNRFWHWHFGRGIVETPSDFGQLSGGASHPELLDWLALEFVKRKWSLKAMHRLIVTSEAYRQTSIHQNDKAADVDPDNTLLWRYRRRRLEAEAIRDSVLSASGRLNTEQFGLPIFPPLPGDIEDRVKYSNSKWVTQFGPEGRKRSIYIYQQRTLTMPLMQTFDSLVCEESRPRRRHSTTPLQALAMYNSEFINEETKHFAERVAKEAGGAAVSGQIDQAAVIAWGRKPTAQESAAFKRLAESSSHPLQAICRVLLNSNEFIHID